MDELTHHGPSGATELVTPARLPIAATLKGRLVRRYKRFFADIETPEGELLTVHCANPGSMRGCAIPGSAVRCSSSDNPKRKLRHTLEMIRVGRTWVGLHTTLANRLARRALEASALPELTGFDEIAAEVRASSRSRLDFRLDARSSRHRDRRPVWLEVKSVTLAEGRLARFPDSVTERGRRHLLELQALMDQGNRAALLFLVQRADCDEVAPADDIDPAYGEALRDAAQAGVEIYALGARVTARAITVERRLPVLL
ncbi:DNA/RNA nuclease SfsA [Myxococcota bacterium]|nr:DNA/RNA nuclease SfsA [Myxococcota bacterium]